MTAERSDSTVSPPSLSDVLAFVSANDELSPVRKRDFRSAILRLSGIVGKQVEMIPADARHLGHCFTVINPAQHGISLKTLQNIKSNLLGAVLLFQNSRKLVPRKQALSNDWQSLFMLVTDKRCRNGLSRFIHFLSKLKIEPNDVNDEVLSRFVDSLSKESFLSDKQIRDSHRRTTRLWNEVGELISAWPNKLLFVPDYRKPRSTYPLSEFPESFQAEVEEHLLWLEGTDPFAPHGPPRRCKPRTIDLRRSQIQLAASALVQRGREFVEIISLSDLVEVESFKEILRFYLDQHDDKPTSFIHGLAITLVSIGQNWLRLPNTALLEIKQVKRQLGPQAMGMTDKNKQNLRQFDDDRNLKLLLELPERLMKLAKSQSDKRAAITVQKAIVIELLLMVPLRMVNVISLQFDKHLVKPGGNRGTYHLVIPGDETKNEQPYEVQLPSLLTKYIDAYRDLYLSVITVRGNPYLFPNKTNGHKTQQTLSQQIKETVKQYTGLDMTGHLFRHLSGKLYLEANPGQYETVRQILGHKNIKTTVNFYTGINTKEATRIFDALVLGERGRLSGLPTHSKKKSRKEKNK
jgi:site-specific recombinase XerD